MYIIVVGAGKVGWNLARELLEKNHEVTVIDPAVEPARIRAVNEEVEALGLTVATAIAAALCQPGGVMPTVGSAGIWIWASALARTTASARGST